LYKTPNAVFGVSNNRVFVRICFSSVQKHGWRA
jgi:hypothetical protein